MDAFAPMAAVASTDPAVDAFGRLVLRDGPQPVGFRVLRDTYGTADAPSAPARRLPSLVQVDLVQDGNALIPRQRTPMAGSHPYWEFVPGVGRTWQEPGDGEWTRAALPFSLMEVNANCLHHGVLTFVFAPAGRISRVAYQVSSETCAYFKADLWGFLQAERSDSAMPDAASVVEAHRTESRGRLPRRPLARLAVDHPGTDPAEFGHPAEVTPSQMSTWGVIADGVHYSGGCPTRAGDYPFCAELLLPSYSVAKSVFGSLGLMRLEQRFPGAREQKVVDFVPECAAQGGWSGVTFGNLLDMSSGHWTSADGVCGRRLGGYVETLLRRTTACREDRSCLWPFSPARGGRPEFRLPHQRYLRAGDCADGFRATATWAAGGPARRRRLARRLARCRAQPRGQLFAPDSRRCATALCRLWADAVAGRRCQARPVAQSPERVGAGPSRHEHVAIRPAARCSGSRPAGCCRRHAPVQRWLLGHAHR